MTFLNRIVLTLKAFLVGLCLGVYSLQTWAGELHFNQVEVKRETKEKLIFVFSLNLTQALHQLLAPQLPFADFLTKYAELPELDFQNALKSATSQLSGNSFLMVSSGAKVILKNWQLPSTNALRELFKANLFLLQLPPGPQSHLPPAVVQAEVQTKTAINRAQLQLHKALHPIFVKVQQDQFWLTNQIPMAVVNVE